MHGVRNNRIAHNSVRHAAGFGIGLLNWDDSTINVSNIIEYNLIQDSALTADDSGAIYILGRSGVDTETVVAGNIIDGVGGGGRHGIGIYLDDSTSGVTVTHNLVRRMSADAVEIHGGSNNLIENNVLDVSQGGVSAVLFQKAPDDTDPKGDQSGNSVVHNVILNERQHPNPFVWFNGGTPMISQNMYGNATGIVILPASPVGDDAPLVLPPEFARGASTCDYTDVEAEAGREIDFIPISISAVGPRPDPWSPK